MKKSRVRNSLTQERVSRYTKKGIPYLHKLVIEKRLDEVPQHLLNLATLGLSQEVGQTTLHLAAKYRQLHLIPSELMNLKNLTLGNGAKWTPIHYAAMSGQLDLIPSGCLTDYSISLHTLTGRCPLNIAADYKSLQCIKTQLDSNPSWMDIRDREGNTLLHAAACSGCINQIPRHLICMNSLTDTNYRRITPVHYAAKFGHFRQIPRQCPLITPTV